MTALVLFAAMLAAIVPVGPAAAQTFTETRVTTFPFTTALFNPCHSELVIIVGKLHEETHVTAREGGLLFEVSVWSKDARAEAPATGAQYVYNEESGSVLNTWYEQDRFVSKQRTVINLVRLGEDGKPRLDDDLFVHAITTFEVTMSTGETKLRGIEFEAKCR